MEKLFLSVFHMSVISCYIILFILIIRFLLRKSPKIFSYVLWTIVFFKLIFPVSYESVISLVPKQLNTQTIETTVLQNNTTQWMQTINIINENPVTNTIETIKTAPSPAYILSIIWLCGVIILFVYNLISILLFHKRLAKAVPVNDNLFETEIIPAPFVIGIIKPKIYIPNGLNDYEKTYIIRHEQVHIHRKDYLIKIIGYSITSIHWFNPLVWLSFILMSRDMEMSCDEKVIKELGGKIKKEYSASLLSLAADRKMLRGVPLAFGENNVKSRIKNVLDYKKPAIWVVILSVVIVVSACIGLFFNPIGSKSVSNNAAGSNVDKSNMDGSNPVSSGNDNFKEKEQPVPLSNFEIAHNDIMLYDGTSAVLKLVMTDGFYYDVEYAGYGGGTYDENYDGTYELQLSDTSGKLLSALKLNADWNYPNINFGGKFDIIFTDYNNDSCPDFTIGTYGSSNMDLYYLYTINKDNQIIRIVKNPISESSKTSPMVFEYNANGGKNQIIAYEYNNAIGEYGRNIYEWDAALGYFNKIKGPIYPDEETPGNNTADTNDISTTGDSPAIYNKGMGTVSFSADITHDGNQEILITDVSQITAEQKATLSVLNEQGDTIWSNEAYLPHAGWNSLYLCTIKDKDYILRYNPVLYDGTAEYSFDLFYLDKSGAEQSVDSDHIEFGINPGSAHYSPDDLAAFADEVNGYLNHSYLLLSTENRSLEYSTKDNKVTRTETYSWLDDWDITYESDILIDKLNKYMKMYSK